MITSHSEQFGDCNVIRQSQYNMLIFGRFDYSKKQMLIVAI